MAERTSIKEKRVLMVLPYLKNGDGIAVAIMNYYQSLIDSGWIVDFLHLKTQDCEWLYEAKKNNGKIFELPAVNKYAYEVKKYIKNIIFSNNYDIVHVNIPGHVGYLTLKYAQKADIKIRIFHAHNPKNIISKKTIISTYIYDYLIQRKSTELIACSKSAGDSRFAGKKYRVIKNVIDIDRFKYKSIARTQIREALKISDKIVIGVVGRFATQKNPDFLVKCFIEYKKLEPKAFLLWIGEGELKNSIEEKLKENHLNDSYSFVGRQMNVEEWYSAMDLFFLPSIFEGMGIVFLEAQCTGLPCLGSTNVPVETEITDLMHRLDLKLSAKEWAEVMKKIIDNTDVRRSRKEAFVKLGYTHESTKDDLKEYYNHLIS